EPSGLVVAALDVIVIGIKWATARGERITYPMHVAALIRHDIGERRHVSAAQVTEQLLDRDPIGEFPWGVLNLSDIRKWVVFHRIQFGGVVISRPVGESRARYRDVLQVRP